MGRGCGVGDGCGRRIWGRVREGCGTGDGVGDREGEQRRYEVGRVGDAIGLLGEGEEDMRNGKGVGNGVCRGEGRTE